MHGVRRYQRRLGVRNKICGSLRLILKFWCRQTLDLEVTYSGGWIRFGIAITKIFISCRSLNTDFRRNDKGSLSVGLRKLPHGLALPDSQVTNFLEVVIEEIQQNCVLFELMKFVDAEPVHVVVDLDDLFTLRAPVTSNFLPQSTAVELFEVLRFSTIRRSKVRLIDCKHVLWIDECSKDKTYRLHLQPFMF